MQGLLMLEYLYQRSIGGFKTCTRREGSLKQVNDNPDEWAIDYADIGEKLPFVSWFGTKASGNILSVTFRRANEWVPNGINAINCKPRYHLGEVLYIKEPVRGPFEMQSGNTVYTYKYDLPVDNEYRNIKWSNKLFMPAKAARAFIRITKVSVERLFDISDEDCLSEGIEIVETYTGGAFYKNYTYPKSQFYYLKLSAKESFYSLFRLANKIKEDAPLKNIWVFCYHYEYLKDYQP